MYLFLLFLIYTTCAVSGFPSIDQDSITTSQSPLPQETSLSPHSLSSEPKCSSIEHWDSCKAKCQKTCSNKDGLQPCPECVPGCVCNAGFVRGSDGNCTLPKFCPFSSEESSKPPIQCFKHQHWSSCRAHCEKNCTNHDKPVPCPFICVSGCVCDSGFVRDKNRNCIRVSKCPRNIEAVGFHSHEAEDDFCPPNEEFSRCRAHCQRNCTNWSDPTLHCSKICVPGCACKNGMVRGPHGNCIRPRRCPPRDSIITHMQGEYECPVDEHFEKCSAQCQKNCTNWNHSVQCPLECVSGCVCDDGYVRGPNGRCIVVSECLSLLDTIKNELKKLDPCPENERKSKHRLLPNSNQHCFDEFSEVVECPATFLEGCVCERGFVRGPDKSCVNLKLLPDANELHFMINSDISKQLESNIHSFPEADSEENCDHTPSYGLGTQQNVDYVYDDEDDINSITTLGTVMNLDYDDEDVEQIDLKHAEASNYTDDAVKIESEEEDINASTNSNIIKIQNDSKEKRPSYCEIPGDNTECKLQCVFRGYSDGKCRFPNDGRQAGCYCWTNH